MPRAGFEDWLERRYPGQSTVRARFSNVRRIESRYGSLEDHWRRDRCVSLMSELRYSGVDAARGAPNPSCIPIDGNIQNGLLTLRNALKLYCEYFAGALPSTSARQYTTARQPALSLTSPLQRIAETTGTQLQPHAPAVSADPILSPVASWSLSDHTAIQLLRLHAATLQALSTRGIIRTENVVGEYGEWLFARAFGWSLADRSVKSYDARDTDGRRFQIKARRDSGKGGAKQLGILRNLAEDGFDLLAAVVFEEDFSVRLAVILTRELIAERAVYTAHQRGHLLTLSKSLVADLRVRDVTAELRAAAR